MAKKKVIAVPDTHFPFTDMECLAWIYEVIAAEKPDVVIQLGDLYDMYCASAFAKTLNIMTPKQEIAEGRLGAEAFWRNVKKAAPKARYIQILGNHDIRPKKRIMEQFPELETLFDMNSLFMFPGVETIQDLREEVEIDGVIYTHGTFTKLGDHCRHYQAPVVHGHSHRPGLFYTRLKDELLWELDCGFVCDEDSVPLRYTATKRTGWVKGLGIIDHYGPRFAPYPGKPKNK